MVTIRLDNCTEWLGIESPSGHHSFDVCYDAEAADFKVRLGYGSLFHLSGIVANIEQAIKEVEDGVQFKNGETNWHVVKRRIINDLRIKLGEVL